MDFFDVAEIGGTRTTTTGYLVADVRVARTGIQQYAGVEVGRPDLDVVNVFRSEGEVFKRDTLRSFAGIPVTLDHPGALVDAATWREAAVGDVGDEIARDGEFIRVPMMLRDAQAIDAVKDGKRELSVGYTCDLKWTSGKTPDGQMFDAIQQDIRANHLAIVAAGRAGAECRIGDDAKKAAITGQGKKSMSELTTVIVDGYSIQVTDQGRQAIEKLQKALSDATDAQTAATETHDRELAKRDGEIADLKSKLTDAEAKILDDAALATAVDARSTLIAQARAILGDAKADFTGKAPAEIHRAVVARKMGDAATDGKSDAYVEVRFDDLAGRIGQKDAVAAAIADSTTTTSPTSVRELVADSRRKYVEARSMHNLLKQVEA